MPSTMPAIAVHRPGWALAPDLGEGDHSEADCDRPEDDAEADEPDRAEEYGGDGAAVRGEHPAADVGPRSPILAVALR